MLRVHFAGHDTHRPLIDLARALGLFSDFPHPEDFPTYLLQLRNHIQVTDLSNAQVVLYAHGWAEPPIVAQVSDLARRAGLPCLFFHYSDDAFPTLVPHGLVYRQSIRASRMLPCERAAPAPCVDPLAARNGEIPFLEKPPSPTIGFCGYVGSPLNILGYRLVGRFAKTHGLRVRRRVLTAIRKTPGLHADFIGRTQFWGGSFSVWPRRFRVLRNRLLGRPTTTLPIRVDTQRRQLVYQEFLDNLLGNAYNVCLRGAGNFSFRFYQTLAAGRIPLFINTDCALPFSDQIDWRKHCVWIEEESLADAGRAVKAFHDAISPDQFRQLQLDNRKLWLDWLRTDSFCLHILRQAVTSPSP